MADPVRAEIISLLSSVANIGQVHNYERYAGRNSELQAHYVYQEQIRGWFLRRVGVFENTPGIGRTTEKASWQIRGYMALDDSAQTELAFDDLLDAIRVVFRDYELNGSVFSTFTPEKSGISVDDTGPVMFAGALCHAARLSLVTTRLF